MADPATENAALPLISPRSAMLGGLPRGMRSADTPPPTPAAGRRSPAGGPVAGAQKSSHGPTDFLDAPGRLSHEILPTGYWALGGLGGAPVPCVATASRRHHFMYNESLELTAPQHTAVKT
jgi:hypothetical protein